MIDAQSTYLKRIRQAYPDLEIIDSRLSPIRSQWSDMFIINEEVLFRFPRDDENSQAVLDEAAALRALKNRLSIPIPEPVYVSSDPQKGSGVFFGYRMIEGTPLSKRSSDMTSVLLNESSFRHIVGQMDRFINELHSIAPDSLGVVLPHSETQQDMENLFNDVENVLFEHMRPDAADWVKRIFTDFLADDSNFSYQAVLRHGNLRPANILLDTATGSVCGVLDFSRLAIGDPAMDVAGLASVSEPFFSYLYEINPEKIGPLMHRAQFYKSSFALRDALAGAREGDEVAFNRGMAAYRRSDLVGQGHPDPRIS